MPAGPATLKPDAVVDGRYVIETVLGEGGMAVVYRARHLKLGTLHALKVLKLPHQAIQERLVTEGQVQARLKHPNIVAVSDIVEVDGAPGLVMEYIDGSSLDELLIDRRLSIEAADALSRGIIAGVAEAHRQGLIHRDLKPANIMLAVQGRELIPKIMDFGLAKLLATDDSGTRSGITMGTPAYMPPEQIRDAKTVDIRADVFATGAILYEIVTGRRAYDGADTLEVFNKVCAGERLPVLELVPDLPRRMQRAIDGALRVDREERIPDCDALLEIWTGEVHSAQPEGPFGTDLFARVRQLGSRPPETVESPVPAGPSSDEHTAVGGSMPPVTNTIDFEGLAALGSDPSGAPRSAGALPVAVEPIEPPAGRRSPLLLLPVLAIGFLVIGGLLGVLIVGTGLLASVGRDGTASTQPVSEAAPEPAPEPVAPEPPDSPDPPEVEPVVEPVGTAVPDPDPEPAVVAPPPAPSPVPIQRPRPRPRPTPKPTRTGAVRIEVVPPGGGKVAVTLLKDQKTFAPGTGLPVGTYTGRFTFPDGETTEGTVTVRAGKTTTITCDTDFYSCE
jgi:serine/threonine-protein kinase